MSNWQEDHTWVQGRGRASHNPSKSKSTKQSILAQSIPSHMKQGIRKWHTLLWEGFGDAETPYIRGGGGGGGIVVEGIPICAAIVCKKN
jgi:hypothetical protein